MKAIITALVLLAVMTSCQKEALKKVRVKVDVDSAIVTTNFANGDCKLFCNLTRETMREVFDGDLKSRLRKSKSIIAFSEDEADFVLRVNKISIDETVRTGEWGLRYSEIRLITEGTIVQLPCRLEIPFVDDRIYKQRIEWRCDSHHQYVYSDHNGDGQTKKEKQVTEKNCRYEVIEYETYKSVFDRHAYGVVDKLRNEAKNETPCDDIPT